MALLNLRKCMLLSSSANILYMLIIFMNVALVVVVQQGKAQLIQLITCKQIIKCVMFNPLLWASNSSTVTHVRKRYNRRFKKKL